MTISVLIPTHNYKCYSLVASLQQQLEQSGVSYEIIVAEDGGKDQVVAIANHLINELPNCRFIRRQGNVGRAAIRNFLADQALGEWLLYIDADAEMVSDSFVSNYLQATRDTFSVIVGGLVNPDTMPSPLVSLRYKYEKAAEWERHADYRNQKPYERFSTFNFLVRKEIITQIPFDEQCKEYGYEDALMGVEIMKRGITIRHIDNPLRHVGFESNKVFLQKSLTAIDTLKSLGDKMVPYTRIGSFAAKMRKRHLDWLILCGYKLTRSILKKNLLGSNPSLRVFAFYKIGYYLSGG